MYFYVFRLNLHGSSRISGDALIKVGGFILQLYKHFQSTAVSFIVQLPIINLFYLSRVVNCHY